MRITKLKMLALTLALAGAGSQISLASEDQRANVHAAVNRVVPALMERHGIPGMAIAVVTPGGHELFEYGSASRETGQPVTPDTLFEIGSISKTFTATLASYAAVKGRLSLDDSVGEHLPALEGTALGKVRVLELATHTPGGMPLQFPDTVTDPASMMAYYKNWNPTYEPGTHRTYANPSVGLLGMAAAASMGEDFTTLMQERLYPALGLANTHLNVPESVRDNYAQGYNRADRPTRLSPGMLAAEAYGVRTTAGDLARFLEANMGRIELEADVEEALVATHTGYYKVGAMTQDLIWEQYAYPVSLEDLLAGNSQRVSQNAIPVEAFTPTLEPRKDVFINKTGSTFGFAAYVAFVPGKELGIVLLANKSYPIDARVTAAYAILQSLDEALNPID